MPAAVTLCVLVLLLLLPLKAVSLPANLTPVDLWAALTLPLCWVALGRRAWPLRLPYLPAFLLILGATLMASLLSADPGAGLVAAVQDVYLYVWLVTLAAVFVAAGERTRRALLGVWCVGAAAPAALLVAQFLHPPLIALTERTLGLTITELEPERASGLMLNSNSAAFFQVLGLVPLVLLAPRAPLLAGLALLSVAGILATGSMGALVALGAGVVVGAGVVLLLSPDARTVGSLAARATVVLLLGLLVAALLLQGGELGERIESVTWARRERSAAGRYDLWQRGADLLLAGPPLWGIGPDRFRQLGGSEMHNDVLGFAVERGLFGLLGLCLFVALAAARGVALFRLERASGRLRAAVFPAALAACVAASLTHEVFHTREIWLILALQEAALWTARRGLAREAGPPARKSWTAAPRPLGT